jgi:hypothetical protein
VPIDTGQPIGSVAAIAVSLLDPAVDRRRAWLEFTGEVLDAPAGARQRNDLLPEFRRIWVPRSRHSDTLLSQVELCPSNRGNSNQILQDLNEKKERRAIFARIIPD